MLDYFLNAKKRVFRLELLQEYDVSEEKESFHYFQKMWNIVVTKDTMQWLDLVRNVTSRGVDWKRSHVVEYPLSEYVQYECKYYELNRMAWENIELLDKKDERNVDWKLIMIFGWLMISFWRWIMMGQVLFCDLKKYLIYRIMNNVFVE